MLFSPLKIKDMELKNRLVLAPMCMYSAKEGFVNDFHIIHYAARALGQIALIIVEATAVLENGQITKNDLGLWNDEQIKSFRWLTKRIKLFEGKAGIQLAHAGRKAKDTKDLFAPSSVSHEGYQTPKAMTTEEIETVVLAFQEAAKRALLAGFDFIEIHAAHGYLIHEFLSPLSNKREDQYGGSLENRMRFFIEVLKAVREEWPFTKPLGIRISATDYDHHGLALKDVIEILNLIPEGLIDVVNVSTGGITNYQPASYPGYQMSYANKIKANTNYIVLGGGLIKDGVYANDLLKAAECDLIYFGRLALREPSFPLRFAKQLNYDLPYLKQYERAKE